MPLYEYRCRKCGKVIELIAKINDPSPACTVDECQGETDKLISAGAFILKGGGWASEGYGGGGGTKPS